MTEVKESPIWRLYPSILLFSILCAALLSPVIALSLPDLQSQHLYNNRFFVLGLFCSIPLGLAFAVFGKLAFDRTSPTASFLFRPKRIEEYALDSSFSKTVNTIEIRLRDEGLQSLITFLTTARQLSSFKRERVPAKLLFRKILFKERSWSKTPMETAGFYWNYPCVNLYW